MKTRIISAIIAIPIFLFFIIMGGYWLKAAVTILALVGAYELYKAVSGKIKPVHFLGFLTIIVYIWLNKFIFNPFYVQMYVFVLLILLFLIMIIFHNKININDVTITMLGIVYLGVTLYTICPIRENGLKLVWLPFIFAWVSDTAAYFVGSAIGKHKLAPILSPKKSVEGAIGGVLITGIVTGIYSYFLLNPTLSYTLVFILFGALGSVAGQIGDIAASAIKRYTGIKDYGNLMPGHGGVLDRFDSVLFTLPIYYIFVNLM